jgi:hypothetical protein
LSLPISKELEEKSFFFLESLLIVFELRKNANHSKLLNQKSDALKDFTLPKEMRHLA